MFFLHVQTTKENMSKKEKEKLTVQGAKKHLGRPHPQSPRYGCHGDPWMMEMMAVGDEICKS